MKYCIVLLIGITLWFIAGCCDPKAESEPTLSYLVGYSILDKRFNTSTRLDLTADILNGTDQDIELTQLILTDQEGTQYTLDYQTILRFSQEGRYNAVPLEVPISDGEIGGAPGIEYLSPGELNFLFMTSFDKAVIKYRNVEGMQEVEVKDLAQIVKKSREDTIAFMQKEHKERADTLAELKSKADARLAENKKKARQ